MSKNDFYSLIVIFVLCVILVIAGGFAWVFFGANNGRVESGGIAKSEGEVSLHNTDNNLSYQKILADEGLLEDKSTESDAALSESENLENTAETEEKISNDISDNIKTEEYFNSMGDILVDISNRYSSRIHAAQYELADLTNTVISGYDEEDISLSDKTEEKLKKAAVIAKDKGYLLKVYDAVRTKESGDYIYDTIFAQLDKKVLIPKEYADNNETKQLVFDEDGNAKIVTDDGRDLLYRNLIIFNSNEESEDNKEQNKDGIEFIEIANEAHEMGAALDVSLCDAESKREMPMPSEIHDLAYNKDSEDIIEDRKENASILKDIMTEAGFSADERFWWHFVDDEVYLNISHIGIF